jgi:hypothetical protein
MTSIQIDNLLKFVIITSLNSLVNLNDVYIIEKWNYFIGIDLNNINTNYSFSENEQAIISEWKIKWNVSNEKLEKIVSIINLITLNGIDIPHLLPDISFIIDMYSKIIDLSSINNSQTYGVHKTYLDLMKSYKKNQIRNINLYLLL